MILGIGVDMVDIRETTRLIDNLGDTFLKSTFTKRELDASLGASNYFVYLSGRFAAKEAFYKAVGPLCNDPLDFRKVETLSYPNGQPYIVINEYIKDYLENIHANYMHISISHEGNYAVAFVIAER